MVTHGGQDEIRNIDLDGSGAAPLSPEDPQRIGPYPLVGLLGEGGMGRVYLGIAEDRYAAVKRVLPVVAQDPDFRRHFNHELDNLARLPAGVSVPLLETGRTENPPWFATEYIPGLTLTEAVRLHEGPLPEAALWYLLRELAGRLKALHALDMLHRDVKPSNVMITLDGLALIDFGIARAADQSRLTKTGMVLGTPEYMAPEQAEGKKGLTGAADVFALGSLLFFAATGASPFGQGSGLDVLYRIVHSEPDATALSELDPALAAIITDCLDKSPSTRPTAADLLERSADGPEPGGTVWPATVAERLQRRAEFAADVPALDEFSAATRALRSSPPAEAGEGVAGVAGAAGAVVAERAGGVADPPPAPEGHEAAEAAAAGDESAKSPRRSGERTRRALRLPIIVPIVLAAGGVTGVILLPYVSSHADGKSSDAPSTVVTASSSTGGSAPSARSSRSASASPKGHSAGKGAKSGSDSGSKTSGSGAAGESGDSSSGGSSGSGAKGRGTSGSGGSSSSSGGSSSGASSGSGGSGGGGGGTIKVGSAGTYRIKDASGGRCLEQDTSSGSPSTYAVSSSCSSTNGSYSQWTFSPASNGTFKVINKGSGKCLTAFNSSGWINMDACGSNSAQHWRIGSTTSSGSTLENTTYSQCMEVAPASSAKVTTCNAAPAQLWSYAGKS
ncbi:protein kinase [Streptomyces spinosirectus]|uniref:protein kinase domain-containing protein n=1 Tax=Streptomyces TaxID=1883 RepID=UPI001C9D9641|nr:MULTISPECIES: protein kinase [Streptomyces]MBY8343531.1 protein kinase [Streptomyces plumbidurans]UIR19829.1 protein kinase [Streptomyces spinosirectus]